MPDENSQNETQNEDKKLEHEDVQISLLKIPPFWNNRPELWFLQVESQFRVKAITSSNTKYDYLVASLSSEAMEMVADVLLNPPATNKYETLKEQLLARSRDSEGRRLDALLHKIQLGDSKPSDLYRQMESLASGNTLVNDSLLRKVWINKLPPNIQACLITIESSHTKEDLFNIADRIHDSTLTSSWQASAIKSKTSDTPENNISETIQRLENRIKNLEVRKSRFRERSRSLSKNSRRSPTPSRICWYHRRYKNNAKKCTKPCKWSTQQTDASKDQNKQSKN